jgi:5-methylcytosine-specific restriction protein A
VSDHETSSPTVWRSRKNAWLRDELILALDLYRREGRSPTHDSVEALSRLLRAIPIEPELAQNPSFRNFAAVTLKVSNFVAIDPSATTKGMSRGGRADAEVFRDFWPDPTRLASTAEAIRSAIASGDAHDADDVLNPEPEFAEAPEGRLLSRRHAVRERNPKLVAKKKAQVLQAHGSLRCEGCGFDFAVMYGRHGEGFIECHHTRPLATLKPGSTTKLADLALVCANCHRMIHRRAAWLTMDQLREVVTTGRDPGRTANGSASRKKGASALNV